MNPLLPKQHGAWAMLVLPFILGIKAGQFVWLHIPLFVGWLFLYLATYPVLMLIKKKRPKLHRKWFLIYFIPALITLTIPVLYDYKLIYFGLAMAPFFLINAYFAKQNNERALLNDFSAITVFGFAGVASYYVGTGFVDALALRVWLLSGLFFLGSTFYIKTMIREKRSSVYRLVSWGFHLAVIIGLIIAGYPLFTIAFIPSVVRSIAFYGKSLSVLKVGILEIVNSVYFLVVLFFLL